MANYGQAMEMARQLEARGGLPPGVTLAMMAQQLMGSNAEQPPLPERGGMPAMTTGLLDSVRAGAAAPVQGDPIAAETAARLARAAQVGGISPEMEAIYAAREARLAAQEEAAPKEDRRAAWDALAQMGFKMAQTTSPYFATALAEGMQAGSQGYSAAKLAAAEKAARREEEKENISLARLEERQKRIAANEAAYGADVGAAEKRAGISKATAEAAKAAVEAKYADTLATIGVEAAEQGLKNDAKALELTDAQIQEIRVRTKLAPELARAQIARDRSGGREGEVSQTSLFSALESAKKDVAAIAAEVNGAILERDRARQNKDPEAARIANEKALTASGSYRAAVNRQRAIEQRMGGGSTPAPRMGGAADFAYVPGKGLVGTQK